MGCNVAVSLVVAAPENSSGVLWGGEYGCVSGEFHVCIGVLWGAMWLCLRWWLHLCIVSCLYGSVVRGDFMFTPPWGCVDSSSLV